MASGDLYQRIVNMHAFKRAQRIPRRADQTIHPVSFNQEASWRHHHRHDPMMVMFYTYALRGMLDVDAFVHSVRSVAARHEVLRASFSERDGQVHQEIKADAELMVRIVDLRRPSEEQAIDAARALAKEEYAVPFDLARGPLLRITLVRVADDLHLLVATFHHIAFDGASWGVFLRELGALYDDRRAGRPHSLPELPIQYADYAAWQRSVQMGEVGKEQLAYWQRTLDQATPLALPYESTTGAEPVRATRTWIIEQPMIDSLRQLSRSENATMFMMMLTGMVTLFNAHTGQPDMCILSSYANRDREGVDRLIGYFANPLFVRVRPERDGTFRGLLAQVRDQTFDARRHADIDIRASLSLPRELTRFNFNYLRRTPPPAFGGITVQPHRLIPYLADFQLAWFLREDPQRLTITVVYSEAMFDPSDIDELGRGYVAVLDAAIADPDAPLATIHAAVAR